MAFRSAAATNQGASVASSIAATMPTGYQSGDVLLAFVNWDDLGAVITAPSGWTTVATQINLSGPDGESLAIYQKVATGSEGTTQTWTNNTHAVSVVIGAWTGRSTTALTSANAASTSNTTSNTSPISASYTGITASNSDDLALFMGVDPTAGGATWSFSTVTGFTAGASTSAAYPDTALQYKDNVSAGATGSLATTITRTSGTGNAGYGGFLVRIPIVIAAPDTLLGQICL